MTRSRVGTGHLLVADQRDVDAAALRPVQRLLGRLGELAAAAAPGFGDVGVAVAALLLVPLLVAGAAPLALLPLPDVVPDRLVPVVVRPGQELAVRDAVFGADVQL
jgi:hypothetical protein